MNKNNQLIAKELLEFASTRGLTNEQVKKEWGFDYDDGRVELANLTCKLLYQKHNGKLNAICEDIDFQNIYMLLFEYVRNIYEVDNSIPLFCYYDYWREFHNDDADDNLSLHAITEACIAAYETIEWNQM